jgi:hypothetical protein
MARIFIDTSGHGPRAWRGMDAYLKGLAAIAEPLRHELVEDPASADFIILTDLNDAGRYRDLKANEVLRRFPEKTFVVYEADFPTGYAPGIYPGMRKQFNRLHRFAGMPPIYLMARLHVGFATHTTFQPEPPPSEPEFLFSFTGARSYWLRERIVKAYANRPGVLVRDSSHFSLYNPSQTGKLEFQQEYIRVCQNSKFIVCPSGFCPVTPRIFEAMFLGRAPVVLADRLIWPEGPRWEEFSIRVRERDYRRIPEILAAHEPRWAEMGRLARQAWETHYAPPKLFNEVVAALERIASRRIVPERIVRAFWPYIELRHQAWVLGRALRHKLIGFRTYTKGQRGIKFG